jgi:hypothetical protein
MVHAAIVVGGEAAVLFHRCFGRFHFCSSWVGSGFYSCLRAFRP